MRVALGRSRSDAGCPGEYQVKNSCMKIDPVVRNMLQINRSGNDRSRQPAVFLSKLINQIMRQPALILTLFLLAAGLQAQKTYIDTLWLKNGTAFTGKIQDYRENKSVAILTQGGVRRKGAIPPDRTYRLVGAIRQFFPGQRDHAPRRRPRGIRSALPQ